MYGICNYAHTQGLGSREPPLNTRTVEPTNQHKRGGRGRGSAEGAVCVPPARPRPVNPTQSTGIDNLDGFNLGPGSRKLLVQLPGIHHTPSRTTHAPLPPPKQQMPLRPALQRCSDPCSIKWPSPTSHLLLMQPGAWVKLLAAASEINRPKKANTINY